jgi:hypothetical protein
MRKKLAFLLLIFSFSVNFLVSAKAPLNENTKVIKSIKIIQGVSFKNSIVFGSLILKVIRIKY